jgi:acetyl esterase/lipase
MKLTRITTIGLVAMLAVANLTVSQSKAATGPEVLRNVAYIEGGHERNRLDLYLPRDAAKPLPLIVWIHGGGWMGGNKDGCPAAHFATKGYVVASINYRLSQHAAFPAQIEDCKAAIRWLRANAKKYHIDPDRVGVWGGSAGGYLVSLLGTTAGIKDLEGTGGNLDQSSRVQAVVDWYGPTDFVHWDPKFNKAVNSMIAQLLGGPAPENEAKARRASPLTYVSKDAAPILIVHGNKDDIVPLSQSEQFAEALKKAGVEVTLQVIPGSGHGGPAFTTPDNSRRIEEFFARHLKK